MRNKNCEEYDNKQLLIIEAISILVLIYKKR